MRNLIKSRLNKVIVIALVLIMAFSSFSVCPKITALEADAVVYVSNSGTDTNAGTAESPVKSVKQAYAVIDQKLKAAGLDTDPEAYAKIILLDDVTTTISGTFQAAATAFNYKVCVTGVTNDTAFIINGGTAQSYYNHKGPTKYENITIKNITTSKYISFHSNGTYLEIGENVKTVKSANSGEGISLAGCPQGTNSATESELIVRSGDWRIVYTTGYTSYINGKTTNFTMTGGTAERVCCGFQKYNGNINIDISDATVGMLNYTPYNTSGASSTPYSGNVFVSLKNATVTGNFESGTKTGLAGSLFLSLDNANIVGTTSIQCTGSVTLNYKEISVPAGKVFELPFNATYNVENLVGGGTLMLNGSAVLNVQNVSGSTKYAFSSPAFDGTHITALETVPDGAFTFSGSGKSGVKTEDELKKWFVSSAEISNGLVLTAPAGVTVNLYKGFLKSTSGATLIDKTKTETVDGKTYHYYIGLAEGKYSYLAKGTGYYTVLKCLNFSSDKAAVLTEINANPGIKSGKGFEATGTITQYTDEFNENALSVKESWKTDYSDVYTTPTIAAGESKAEHEFTTQDEMENYITSLDKSGDDMYIFSVCKSPSYNYDMPLVIFTKTDLSSALTIEEAVNLLKGNGKLNVMYQGQIHGNEPAGGEGALAIIKAMTGPYGQSVIESANLLVLPRANPDGSRAFTRNNVANEFDMNRDHIKVQSEEVTAIHNIYNMILPEVFIDGHEYTCDTSKTSGNYRDILFAVGGGYNSTTELVEMGTVLTNSIIDRLQGEGIRSTYYPATSGTGAVKSGLMTNTANFSSGRGYYSLKGSITLLVETRGINCTPCQGHF